MSASGRIECKLCQQAFPGGLHRLCGLDVCDYCCKGIEIRARVEKRGFRIEVEKWHTEPRREQDVRVFHTRVTGSVRASVHPKATFSREGLGHRVAKLFGRDELQVGDPLFDKAVYVETEQPDEVASLLGGEGMQMAVLEALAEYGTLEMKPTESGLSVQVHTTTSSRSSTPAPTQHQLMIAILLHHIDSAVPP